MSMLAARGSGSEGQRSRSGGSNVPLGIKRKFATTCPAPKIPLKPKKKKSTRAFRFWLAYRQREEIINAGLWKQFKTLCSCRRYALPSFTKTKDGEYKATGAPGHVQIAWYGRGAGDVEGKSPLAFAWVQKCASPMLCFIDAPIIRQYRSEELRAICRKMLDLGYRWFFTTYTAPHDLSTDPEAQVKAMREAYRMMTKDRRWALFRKKYGIEFVISAVEMTDDAPWLVPEARSGCHFHFHQIVFYKRDAELIENEAVQMRNFISRRWIDCLSDQGMIPENKRKAASKIAFRLDLPRKPKNENPTIEEVIEYMVKGAAVEMTPGIFVKDGKQPKTRVTHWQLMALALTKYPSSIPRMLSIMKALKGRHWLRFPKALRDLCGLSEVDDDEILKQKASVVVSDIDDDDWRLIDGVKFQKRFIDGIVKSASSAGFDLSEIPVAEDGKQLDLERPEAVFVVGKVEGFLEAMRGGWCPDADLPLLEAVKNPPPVYE